MPLGHFGGTDEVALDVNYQGDVVGFSVAADGAKFGIIWSNGIPRPFDADEAGGSAINSKGEIAGHSFIRDSLEGKMGMPTVWKAGIAHVLTQSIGWANDINELGWVVGLISHGPYTFGSERAFVFDGQQTHDLTSMVEGPFPMDHVIEALAINNSGTIIATGVNPDGQIQGFVLTPIR